MTAPVPAVPGESEERASVGHVSRIPCGSEFGGVRCVLPSGHALPHNRPNPLAGIVWTTPDNLRAGVKALMDRYDRDQAMDDVRTLDALDVIADLDDLLYPRSDR